MLSVFCPFSAPAAPTVQQLLLSADAAYAADRPHLAIYYLDQALAIDPTRVAQWKATAWHLGATGHPALAAERWQQVAALAPHDGEAYEALNRTVTAAVLPEPGPKLSSPPESGLGMWVSGDTRAQVRLINIYNVKAPRAQRVKYVFVNAGQWILDGARSRWALDLRSSLIAADVVAGESQVHLWIEGSAQGAAGLTPADWDSLAAALDTALAGDRRLAGVHLAPRNASPDLYPLYAALRRKLTVPLSVAVAAPSATDFSYADFLVLKAAKATGNIETFESVTKDRATAFFREAAAGQGKGMVGVPGMGGEAAVPASAYLEASQRAIGAAIPQEGDAFLGIAVMGLVEEDEAPVVLAEDVWKLLELPVVRP